MPARQDQTLQIVLIVCIFAFLVTAVVAYLGWRGYGEASRDATQAKTSLSNEQQRTQTQQTEIEDLRQMLGVGRNDAAENVKKAFEDDMKAYGGGLEEASRSYRKVLETVNSDAQKTAQREAALESERKNLTTKLAAVEAAAKKQIDQYDEQRKKAEADLAAERNSFQQDRATLEAQQKELMKTVEDQKTAFEAKLAEHAAEKKQLEEKITELEHAVEIFKEQRKDEPGSFEVADGRISYVSQDGTVWINLGTADALRRQVTFSVYDAGQHDADKATKKGSIEVTRVMGEHMAEARVTEDDPTNPILTGDLIYSQVWHRGKKLHFALTGVVDIDGDGRSDHQLARDLIELNGGVVDAYLKDDGTVDGEISANTRYLVLGELPESVAQAKLQDGWNAMYRQAQSLGVETITLSQFLNQMGYKPQDRSVTEGSATAPSSDAAGRPIAPSTQRPGGGQRFRPRTPFRAAPAAATAPE